MKALSHGRSADTAKSGRGIALVIVATAIYAVADTLSKYLVRDYPVLMIGWARYAVPFVLLLATFLPRRGVGMMRTAFPALQLGRGILLSAGSIIMLLAYRVMPMAEAQAISFVHPLLLMLLAVVFLGEKVRPLGWLAVFLGFAGVLIIVRPGGALFTPAALLPLSLALTYSSYQMLTRAIATRESSINSLFYVLAFGTVTMTIALPFFWVQPSAEAACLFAGIGVTSGIAHYSNIKALEYAPASLLAPFAYIQLFWIAVFGVIVFGDFPDVVTLVGMVIVVAGGLLAAAFRRGKRSGVAPDTASQ